MNPVAILTFFNETCEIIFNHLFRAEFSNSGFFNSGLAYFRIIKINGRDILHLQF